MLLIEFDRDLKYESNILKYRNIDNDVWEYLYIDIEMLSILLANFAIISTLRIPTNPICLDTPLTGKNIQIKYCGVPIEIYCNNNSAFYLPIMEQNY